MEILKITDNNDGSATIEVEMTEEEQQLLLEYAITNILKDYMKEHE